MAWVQVAACVTAGCYHLHDSNLLLPLTRVPQALAALKAKAGEKGTFGGKGLSYSGKK